MATLIKCPKCSAEIEVSTALGQSIRDDLEKELAGKYSKESEEKIKLEVERALSVSEDKVKLIQEELKFKSEKLDQARHEALLLHQEKIKLEDEKKSFELEKKKQLDEEREKIRQQTLTEFSESHRLMDLEKDKKLSDLQKSLEEARIKASQSSQQLQGEVLELDLEELLKNSFPSDEVTPIEKGVRGADINQVVKTKIGNVCGVILWELKRQKAWNEGWVTKLKDDLMNAGVGIPVIITTSLPKEIQSGFGSHNGVWVSEPKYVKSLAEILRKNLIDVAREKHNSQDRGTKADSIYSYLISDAFVRQVQNIVEAQQNMKSQIESERRAYEKIWKEREAQAQRIISSTIGIYASIHGIAGQSLPQIKGLDLLEP